jgi:hypothetical protein
MARGSDPFGLQEDIKALTTRIAKSDLISSKYFRCADREASSAALNKAGKSEFLIGLT